jgi:FAD synthetase
MGFIRPPSIHSSQEESLALNISELIEKEFKINFNNESDGKSTNSTTSMQQNGDYLNEHSISSLVNNIPSYSVVYFKSDTDFSEMQNFMFELCSKLNLKVIVLNEGGAKQGLQHIIDKMNIKAVFMGVRSSDPHASKLFQQKRLILFSSSFCPLIFVIFVGHLKPFTQTDSDWPQAMRVLPILDWSYNDIWTFLKQLDLSYCSLYDKGYSSIGRVHNTSPNPHLKNERGEYLPAYKLNIVDSERSGRLNSS